jgi:dihydropyrimidinase
MQLSEDLSFRRILRLAESVPGTGLYMMHVSAGTGVAAIVEARGKGLPIYGETLHQYLIYSAQDYKRPNGQIYHTYPSLKSLEDQKALWHGTANDAIHCIATDELCCTLKDKTMGNRIDDTTGGNSGVEPRLGVMYTEMVARRGHSLPHYVDLVRPMPPGSWGSTRARARSRPGAMPTSRSSIRCGAVTERHKAAARPAFFARRPWP